MGKYLKKFETRSQYESYISGEDKQLPNVSCCIEDENTYYNPLEITPEPVINTDLIAKFNVTSTSGATNICGSTSNFSEIEIDGVVQPSVTYNYLFTTTGEHTVKYTLVNSTTIGNSAFSYCYNMTSIVIPNDVTTIDNSAFQNCNSLTSIEIPNNVTTIGDYAFQNCYSLTGTLTIPNSVTSIGREAFVNSNSLKSVVINCSSIGRGCFERSGLETVEFGNNVTTIGENAFFMCPKLKSVVIPSSVTTIGYCAFYKCETLVSAIINGGAIGQCAFSLCNNLSYLKLGDNVTTIGTDAFSYCSSLKSIYIPSNVTDIGNSAFRNTSAKYIILHNNGTVGQYAFGMSSGLTVKVLYIGSNSSPSNTYSSSELYGLETLYLNNDDGWCFRYSSCYGTLINVIFGNNITTIADYAFYGLSKITNIVLPSSITSIGNYAFNSCSLLSCVTVEATTPPTFGSSAITKGYNANNFKIFVPAESVEAYKAASGWSSLASYIEAIPTT